jgi:hypothetical protein
MCLSIRLSLFPCLNIYLFLLKKENTSIFLHKFPLECWRIDASDPDRRLTTFRALDCPEVSLARRNFQLRVELTLASDKYSIGDQKGANFDWDARYGPSILHLVFKKTPYVELYLRASSSDLPENCTVIQEVQQDAPSF